MGIHRAEQSIEIDAPIEACFAAITDYETFSEWQAAVKEVRVHSTYPDGLGKEVELIVDAKFRTIRYRLRYRYERPSRVWWDFLEADGVKHIEGDYLFEGVGDGRTRAVYRVGIDPGVWVPGKIAKSLNEQVMRRSVEELKARAEATAATAG